MRIKPSVFLVVTALSGCGTVTSWMPLNQPPRTMGSRPEAEVTMFTASRPTRAFVEVGVIATALSSNFSSANVFDIYAQIRREAAHRGCDGVVVSDEEKLLTGNSTFNTVNETTSRIRAACIVYDDEAPASKTTVANVPPAPGSSR